MTRLTALIVLVVSVVLLGSCGRGLDTPPGRGVVSMPGMTGMTSTTGAPDTARSGGVRGSMMLTSESGYLEMMLAHHLDAIRAAEELRRSDEPAVRRLGRSIVRTQSEQVVQMRDWLQRWHPRARPDTAYTPMMDDLTGLDGHQLDTRFLSEMIPHHMVAVMASRRVLMSGLVRHRAVAVLARRIISAQMVEIAEMRRLLARER